MVLARRDLAHRFTGSLLGRFWLVLSPLIMLGIYVYFFGAVLQAKWSLGPVQNSLASFAVMIFSGLILHQFFSECITRAPELVLSNPNYVKKIIFPTEILSIVALLSTSLQLLISLLILMAVFAWMSHVVFWTWLYIPFIYLPFMLITLGIMWFLASLGVFLRDLRQIIQFVAAALLFLSPVFYPMDRLPEALQFLKYVNPLVIVIEQSRLVLFAGIAPDGLVLATFYSVSFILAAAGYCFFMRSKPAFADVI